MLNGRGICGKGRWISSEWFEKIVIKPTLINSYNFLKMRIGYTKTKQTWSVKRLTEDTQTASNFMKTALPSKTQGSKNMFFIATVEI